ncbi:MAG: hypothetical protein K8S25_07590, partial [Alphaproteobacteria bacterium]|nr:hypothetical protein [Alphaproteobacteria bacterium]
MSAGKFGLTVGASLIALSSIGFPGDAQACACCSEIGQRLEQNGAMDAYERGELGNVRFAAVARLFSDPGFPDSVEGVASPSDQDYRLVVRRQGNGMVFELADVQGRAGRISFPLPKKLTRFEVDPRDAAAEPGGNGPVLYKEWRLDGVA